MAINVVTCGSGSLLRKLLSNDMPRKYQNPTLETRKDVDRPFYFIRVTVPGPDGKRRRVPKNLGYCDQITKKEAMKRRSEALDLVNAGKVLAQTQIRFKDLVEQFKAARLPQLGAGTQDRYISQIDTHILPAFGATLLADIDKPTIEAWLTGKADTLSWWSREGLRGVMSAIFTAAKDWNLWTGDLPTKGIRLGRKTEVREKKLLTAEQLQAIMAASSDRTRFMILTAFLTGLRISEVCGLQWQDIDLDRGTLTVKRRWYRGDLDEPKTPTSKRKLELGPLAVEFRNRYPGPHEAHRFIFSDDGKTPVDERDILRFELRPILKRLGVYVDGMGWHAFRRTHVTMRQTVGGAVALEAMAAAGHSDVSTTAIYSLLSPERDREQVSAMFDHLMSGGSTVKQ